MSSGRYMAYSPSPSAPQSPHIAGIRSASSAIAEQEKYLSELLAERHKLSPFVPVLPYCYRLLNQDIERWFARKFPESKFVHKNHTLKHLPLLPLRLNFMRLFFRTAYVAITTGIAVLFPYFNQMIGLSGAITFWPVVIYFPVEMYLTQKKFGSWKSKAIALRIFAMVCLVVIFYAFVGSVRGVIVARFG